MITDHEFRPYADNPALCVAELTSGDTCNRERDQHTGTTIAELIESMETALQFLSANESTMPRDIMRRMRDEAITLGTALLNERIDYLTTAQVWRLHELIVDIDRIGH